MRYGFTTGSCSAAAAKAAAYMLFSDSVKNTISIQTPKGIPYNAELVDIERAPDYVCCGVVKDGGDDPDITTGMHVYAKVEYASKATSQVIIDGGEGIGRVTAPGLDQPVGNAAINTVPRRMIEQEVREVMDLFDYHGSLKVTIFIPGGAALAEKTFNPRLGIVGGISVLGTSGIVEPMSTQAIKDTIFIELRQRVALGQSFVAVAPGNYGRDYVKEQMGLSLDPVVKCSNFIGETIDMAAELNIKGLLLIGHIGKLIKVSGGIMNTHSSEGDMRMELMAKTAETIGAPENTISDILKCTNTTQACTIIKEAELQVPFMQTVADSVHHHINQRAAGRLKAECIVFSSETTMSACSAGTEAMKKEIFYAS